MNLVKQTKYNPSCWIKHKNSIGSSIRKSIRTTIPVHSTRQVIFDEEVKEILRKMKHVV
jgi:hypothetical protein